MIGRGGQTLHWWDPQPDPDTGSASDSESLLKRDQDFIRQELGDGDQIWLCPDTKAFHLNNARDSTDNRSILL